MQALELIKQVADIPLRAAGRTKRVSYLLITCDTITYDDTIT